MDNFFASCPPMMSDGARHLTDYQTATRRNEQIKYINDAYRDDQYRLFLQKNGLLFMTREWKYHKKRNSCRPNDCIHHYPTRSLPRHFWQERQAYDSIYNKQTNAKMAPFRKCYPYADYRLNPAYNSKC